MASGFEADVLSAQHIKYLQRCLKLLPTQMLSLDTNRVTVAFFLVCGLDTLNQLETLPQEKRAAIADWIYAQQVKAPAAEGTQERDVPSVGFRGSSFLGVPYHVAAEQPACSYRLDGGHIANTYTAVATLSALGDDFSRLDRVGLARDLARHQLPDGSFVSTVNGGESDMRFVYCACCVASMLGDWSGVDRDAATRFIQNSIAYDGGIGQGPGLEAHAGSTFCAIASLKLMGRLEDALSEEQRRALLHWLISCQTCGFHGRPHKDDDTCYSFWVGGALNILGHFDLIDQTENRKFLLRTQYVGLGGFSKHPDNFSDPLHTYMGLSALSMMGEPGVAQIDPVLNITQRAANQVPCKLGKRTTLI